MCPADCAAAACGADLRDVTSNLKLITDLERIADHAVEISGYALNLQEMGNTITIPPDLIRLAELTRQILRRAGFLCFA